MTRGTEILRRERIATDEFIATSCQLRILHRHGGVYLIVEDNPSVAQFLSVLINGSGKSTVHCSTVKEAHEYIESVGSDSISCCVVDLNLNNGTPGEKLVDWLEHVHKDIPVVVYTGSSERAEELSKAYPWLRIIHKCGGTSETRVLTTALALSDGPVEEAV